MQRLRSHCVGVETGSRMLFADYQHDGVMWAGEGERELRHGITFSEPFAGPPSVKIGISLWDVANTANHRMDLTAENITAEGFDIVFRTWEDTRVARVRADWLAIGELRDEDDWDVE